MYLFLYFFICICNGYAIITYFDEYYYFGENLNELKTFYKFICENNPILLDYYDDNENEEHDNNVEVVEVSNKTQIKYEDKYVNKFNTFPNEFRITETEFIQENEEYEMLKLKYEKTRLDTINSIQEQLLKIQEIQERGDININKPYTENINSFGLECLLKMFDEDDVTIDIEDLYQELLINKEELLEKLDKTEKMVMTEEEMRKNASKIIINKKLDKYIDNYILEHTPLGNIFMRYNNDKKSFEYFSNNTIPYRYLESVGRRYVMTYWCKPIFIDINEELKRVEEKYDEENVKQENVKQENVKNNPRNVISQFKNYNKEIKDKSLMSIKNRSNKNYVLPPQIRSMLPDVNKKPDRQLLKENANRYTWEGRLSNFSLLKKIDKKVVDKNLSMTYADFKKMQQSENKN